MRVYVTGMGALSSLGNNTRDLFQGLLEGRSGVRQRPDWSRYKGLGSHLCAPVPEYDIGRLPRAARRSMSRMSEMATLATLEALEQAKLPCDAGLSSPRTLLCLGSTTGSPDTLDAFFRKMIERGGPEGQFSTTFFKIMNHSVASNVAVGLGFVGPVLSPSSACSTSAHAIILGWELIQSGLYDIVVAGGADEVHYTTAAVFDIVQAASRKYNDNPDASPRPFDNARDGLVVSEGAGMVVLESEKSVAGRGVVPLAELKGGAYVCDGTHMSQPQAASMAKTMRLALERADCRASQIDYVNAHATATLLGDIEEAQATAEVFGAGVPVSSLKGHLGHSLAACGAIDLIASVKMMETACLIPTRNLTEVDPRCAAICHLTGIKKVAARTILSNNFAFGGMNTSLIVSATTS